MKLKKDYIAMWFEVRKEQGISDTMNIGQMHKVTGDIKWYDFAHSDMDGLGGVATILRENGYPCTHLPTGSDRSEPSLWQLYQFNKAATKDEHPKNIRWRKTHICSNSNEAPIVNDFFDRETTALIKRNAKKNKVALSSYLLWALNKSIADNLIDGYQHYYWFYPVNLRGAITLSADTANYSSGINICLNNNISPNEIQLAIKKKIKSKEYWTTWLLAHVGRLVGKPGVRYLYKLMSKKNFYAGSFSFLGGWPLKLDDNPNENADEVWVTCGIGTKNYPVSTGVMEWHGQLTLGLKLHPWICDDINISRKCLQDWKQYLTEEKDHNAKT